MKESYLIAIKLYEEAVAEGAPPDRCGCCGAAVAEGVKGCFEMFSELTIRRYPDAGVGLGTFYGVDAHALQHPEIHGKKNNAAHLLRLHWIFAHDQHAQSGTVPRWWQQYLQRSDLPPLAPPRERGTLTVVDVAAATTAQAHAAAMRAWAQSVYHAWGAHHEWARRELALIFR